MLKKIVRYFKRIIGIFFIYSFVMFFYTVLLDTPLGEGYRWNCFEPGCSISNHELMWNPSNKKLMPGIMGDICELSLTDQYIIGRVCEPNEYSKEHNTSDAVGYFILDKINLTKKLGMSYEEFQHECENSEISDCRLKYKVPFWVIYDPYYWYVMFLDLFN